MRFVYHPSIDVMGEDADDLIDKDNGNITVASDVEEQYQPLLLAAPDLLEACKNAILYMEDQTTFRREQIRKVEAAIAKAEGKS